MKQSPLVSSAFTINHKMARIHVLPEHVANKIAAGEVVERPASVVKELLENSLDAGARRIKVQVEAGGRKLIQITDDGCGMVRDDALLAFERHATSKIKNADDLLNIATLGFRGEALPSIASVSRLLLETRAADESSGTLIEINGGKMQRVEDAGLPSGTTITVRDLFFNIPARRKFLKAESTELSHIASLVTHYALAHPEMHFELHSMSNAMLVAPPVAGHSERVFQVFGKEILDQLIPVSAELRLEHVGLPQPPPWKRDEDYQAPVPGELKLHGFVSKPEVQKLNRNSIFIFVNRRLIRDRVVQHAITEAYRNVIPPTVFPVVLLFLELPGEEVDVNVHPSKTEVRFRQGSTVHDFIRDSLRAALMQARPVPQFTREIHTQPTARQALTQGIAPAGSESDLAANAETAQSSDFVLQAPTLPPRNESFSFQEGISIDANAAASMLAPGPAGLVLETRNGSSWCSGIAVTEREVAPGQNEGPIALGNLKPLGQIRDSFIIAADPSGLWIIDQHVAHERVLFERILRQRETRHVESQRLLMPLIVELTAGQQAVFAEISDELRRNGFEVEPFGAGTIAVKAAPGGIDPADVERLLHELLDHLEKEDQSINLEKLRGEIAASIACHAAIKVNMPLEHSKMEWLISELSKTQCPMSCPHGRPVVLRYSVRDIQKAFKRI
ncbi:MAG TPA: DNA mismatch repair endonuclease MutL [Terriglobales bacterium]|nr:DNA mismatch repair endonuclease MutL [Terriglobales bacterium]